MAGGAGGLPTYPSNVPAESTEKAGEPGPTRHATKDALGHRGAADVGSADKEDADGHGWISINQARKVASWKRNTDLSLCHHCALSGQGAAKRGHSARLRPTPSGLLCRRRRFAGAHGLGRLGVGLYCLQRPVYRRRETGSSARRRRSRPSLPTTVGVAAPTACREKSGSIGSGAPIGRTK